MYYKIGLTECNKILERVNLEDIPTSFGSVDSDLTMDPGLNYEEKLFKYVRNVYWLCGHTLYPYFSAASSKEFFSSNEGTSLLVGMFDIILEKDFPGELPEFL